MRGRKPTPVEQRVAEGNPQKRPLPDVVLVAGRPEPDEFAEPPAHLPELAREFWRVTVAQLIEVGIADRVDAPVLEMLAVQYARWRHAMELVEHDGILTENPRSGAPMVAPAVRVERDAHMLFLRTAEHYALTPIARTRLGLAELHRRTLAAEMTNALGEPALRVVDGGDG